jgi:DNA invertase Pin-like site-specific DNA recombinase
MPSPATEIVGYARVSTDEQSVDLQRTQELDRHGIGLRVLDGAMTVDTSTPSGKLVFGLFALLAEFERDLLSERTRAGLAAARARGRKGGRPSTITPPTLEAARQLRESSDLSMEEIRQVAQGEQIRRSALCRFPPTLPFSRRPPQPTGWRVNRNQRTLSTGGSRSEGRWVLMGGPTRVSLALVDVQHTCG